VHKLVIVALVGLGMVPEAGAQVRSFSLKEAQEYAVRNNYQARNAIIDVALAAKAVKENLATGLPQVDGSIGYNNFINLATQLIPAEFFGGEPGTYMEVQFGTKHNANAQLQVSQLVFSGQYIVGLKVAKEFVNLSKLQLEQVEQDVKQAIANAYYLVLVSERNKELMEETITTMEKLLADTQAMYRQGFMQDTDVDKISLLLSDLKTNVLNAENQVKNAMNLLKFNLGLSVHDEISLSDNLDMLLLAVNPRSSLDEAFSLEDHVTFKLMENQQTISEYQIQLAKSAYLPTVSAFLNATGNAQRNKFNFFDFDEKWYPTSLFGLQFAIPIFSSGNRMYRVQQANLELEKTKNSRAQVNESLVMGAVTARNNLEIAVETYNNKNNSYMLAKRIYEKEQIKYKNGVSSSTDLNQSYNQLLESQGAFLGATLDMMNKKLELDKAYSNL